MANAQSQNEWQAILSEAIHEAKQHPESSDFILSQLYGGIVRGNDELESIWSSLTAPEQVRLDLHLTGPSVKNHATNAVDLGNLSRYMADAVKETTKELLNFQRYSSKLLVEGATQGSVRLVFRVPDQPIKDGEHALKDTEASSQDSRALRMIAVTLNSAESAGDLLPAHLRHLPLGARQKLQLLSKSVKHAGWDIEGVVEQKNHAPESLRFNPESASRIIEAVKENSTQVETRWVQGTIDGFRRGVGDATLNAPGGSIRVAVTDPDLMETVAHLAADKDQVVVAKLDEIRRISATGGNEIDKSRRLVSIDPVDRAVEEPLPFEQ